MTKEILQKNLKSKLKKQTLNLRKTQKYGFLNKNPPQLNQIHQHLNIAASQRQTFHQELSSIYFNLIQRGHAFFSQAHDVSKKMNILHSTHQFLQNHFNIRLLYRESAKIDYYNLFQQMYSLSRYILDETLLKQKILTSIQTRDFFNGDINRCLSTNQLQIKQNNLKNRPVGLYKTLSTFQQPKSSLNLRRISNQDDLFSARFPKHLSATPKQMGIKIPQPKYLAPASSSYGKALSSWSERFARSSNQKKKKNWLDQIHQGSGLPPINMS